MIYSPSYSCRFVVFLLVILVSAPGLSVVGATPAARVDIFSADVELADNSASSRQEAFRQALAKVLVKLSGQREILEAPATEKMLDNAQRYVQAYQKDKVAESANRPPSESTVGVLLHVEFDGPALERELIAAGLPVWSGVRPATLVWLAIEDHQRRSILSENSKSTVLPVLRQAAAARGLPVVVPLMDQTDQKQVEFIDIKGEFTGRLQQASERYNVADLLIGTLQSTGPGGWKVKWSVSRENVSSSWTEADLPLEQALQSGIDGLADILSSRYAFVSTPGEQRSEYILSVDNVTTLQQYATVLKALQKFVFVENATPVLVKESQVRYLVRMRGSSQELERALALTGELRKLETGLHTGTGDPDVNKTNTEPDRNRVDLYFALIP